MAHRIGDPFDDEDDIPISVPEREALSGREAEPIAERVQRGIEAGNHRDGAIVPLPAHLRGNAILDALTGDERKKHQGLIWHRFRPTVYEYRDGEGRLLMVVVRYDHAQERKRILPLRYCGKGKDGLDLFWFTWIPGTKPIFGGELLAERPQAPVLFVQGEKTAVAARLLFPDHAVISWPSGAQSARHVDLAQLAGRSVKLWPDNDVAGRKAMRVIGARAYEAGAANIAVVDVPAEFEPGWDLADALPDALAGDPDALRRMLNAARTVDPLEAAALLRDPRRKAAGRRLLGYKPGYSRVEPERVAEALGVLDADMDGASWYAIARCLYFALADAGLPVLDAWSAAGDKYKEGEPASLWERFAQEEGFSAPPLAWLLRKARKAAEQGKHNVEVNVEALMLASIEEVSEDHAVVTRGAKTVVVWEQFDPRAERYSIQYLDTKAFVDKLVRKVAVPNEQAGKPPKMMPVGKLWHGSAWRRQYDGVIFAPGVSVGARNLNMWRGFAVEPVDNPAGCSHLKDHLLQNVARGDETAFDYILDWLAFAVQRLDRPVGVALVLVGPKGAGKSVLIDILAVIFGASAFVTSQAEDVVGRFNEPLEDTLLFGVEEAFAPHNRAADGTLKDMITRRSLRVEAKFFRPFTVPNHLRVIMTSNNDQVVRADGNERRYAVFEVTNPHIADPHARRAYFGAMREQMEFGGYEAMLGELLARDISRWNPEAIPETEALRNQKLMNLSNDPMLGWYYGRLEDGNAVLSGEAGTPIYPWSADDATWVPVADVVADYAAFAKRHGKPGDDRRLKTKLERYMPPGWGSANKRQQGADGKPLRKHYPFPPLGQARALFAKATGYAIDAAGDEVADDGGKPAGKGGGKPAGG